MSISKLNNERYLVNTSIKRTKDVSDFKIDNIHTIKGMDLNDGLRMILSMVAVSNISASDRSDTAVGLYNLANKLVDDRLKFKQIMEIINKLSILVGVLIIILVLTGVTKLYPWLSIGTTVSCLSFLFMGLLSVIIYNNVFIKGGTLAVSRVYRYVYDKVVIPDDCILNNAVKLYNDKIFCHFSYLETEVIKSKSNTDKVG